MSKYTYYALHLCTKLFIAALISALVRLSSAYRPVRTAASGAGAAVVRRRGSARGGHRCHCPRRRGVWGGDDGPDGNSGGGGSSGGGGGCGGGA